MPSKNVKRVYEQVGGAYIGTNVGDGIPCVPSIVNLTLSADTWTEWEIPEGVRNFTAKARTSGDILVSTTQAGTTYLTMPAGSSLNMDVFFGKGGANRQSMWLKSVAGNTMEILTWTEA